MILEALSGWRRIDRRLARKVLRAWLSDLLARLQVAGFAIGERFGYRPVTRRTSVFMPPVAIRLAKMLCAGECDKARYTLSRLHQDSLYGTVEAMLDCLQGMERSARWLERLWDWYRDNREIYATTVLILGLLRHARNSPKTGKGLAERRDAYEEAERLLDRVMASQPENADMLSLRLVTARGLGLPPSDDWKRFRALLQVAPMHYRGHLEMLENLKPGRVGNHDAMFRLARARAASLPPAHPLRALPLFAHFAAYEAAIANGDPAAAAEWFGSAAVEDEIVDIWLAHRQTLIEQGSVQADELLNHFAAALYLCQRFDLAAEALEHMDNRCSTVPWNLLCQSAKERYNPAWAVDRIKAEITVIS